MEEKRRSQLSPNRIRFVMGKKKKTGIISFGHISQKQFDKG